MTIVRQQLLQEVAHALGLPGPDSVPEPMRDWSYGCLEQWLGEQAEVDDQDRRYRESLERELEEQAFHDALADEHYRIQEVIACYGPMRPLQPELPF